MTPKVKFQDKRDRDTSGGVELRGRKDFAALRFANHPMALVANSATLKPGSDRRR